MPTPLRWLRSIRQLDRRAALAAPRFRHPALTPIMLAATYSGTAPVWLAVAAVLVLLARQGSTAIPDLLGLLSAMCGALVSLLIGQVIKRVLKRRRPFATLEDHDTVGMRPWDESMPSTHSSTSFALFVGLLRIAHPWAAVVGVWAGLVASSRYYTGVHYPSDIAVGILLGTACGLLDWSPVTRQVLLGT